MFSGVKVLLEFFLISAYTLKIQLFLGGTSFQGTMDKLDC